jgi:signal transduction histidine kinase
MARSYGRPGGLPSGRPPDVSGCQHLSWPRTSTVARPRGSSDDLVVTAPGVRRLVLGLVTLSLVLLGGGFWLEAVSNTGLELRGTAFSVGMSAGLLPVGALVALRQPRNAIGWVFLALGLSVGLGVLSGGYAAYWTSGAGGSDGLGKAAAAYATSGWAPWVLVPSTFLLLIFPEGRLLPGRRWRIVALAAGAGIAFVWLGSLLMPGALQDYPHVRNPLGIAGLSGPLSGLGYLFVAVGLAGSIAAVVRRFRYGTGEQRDQIKWIVLAGVLIVLVVPLAIALYDVVGAGTANVVIVAAVSCLPLAAGVAILRYRLYDIDVVVNRTLVYAALTAGLAGVYAAVALGLGMAIGSGAAVPTAAATLVVALLFRPLRAGVQAAVDRRFDRARYEGLRTVERFLADLRAGRTAPERAGSVLAEALTDPTLELLYWLPEEGVHVDATGRTVELPEARARTPVRRGELQLATVIHDRRLVSRPNLVDGVLAAAGLAIEIGRLRAEVRRRLAEVEDSRRRIVTAGYEERRRLERDLHDGAQQRLVSIGLALRHVQSRLPQAGEEAHALDASVAELGQAINELRELARGVRPAGLDDGLATAIHGLASRSSLRTQLHVTDERFEDRLETAAYFVASEALTNAVKHASASAVTVNATRRNGDLVISISDDGVGGASADSGSGLVGLSDRVAALGGRLRVDSPVGRGTVVTVELPCE